MTTRPRPSLVVFRRKRRSAATPVTVRTAAGEIVWLPRVAGAAGLRRAAGSGKRWWRDILPGLCGQETPSDKRLNLMLLVLAAKRIPHILPSGGRGRALLVPVLYEGIALHEIRAFEAERERIHIERRADGRSMPGVLCLMLALILWHGLRMHWFAPGLPDPPFPRDPAAWPTAFGLDAYRTVATGEWWRSLTALCLHADTSHLFGNIGFGMVFFWALGRRLGAGPGIAFALAAGLFGNAANALYKPAFAVSLGFSTALFGALGVLSGVAACDASHDRAGLAALRAILFPAATGLAFLGFLGGGGELRTDFAAHVFGFAAGLLLGPAAWVLDGHLRLFPQNRRKMAHNLFGALTGLSVVLTWAWAAAGRM